MSRVRSRIRIVWDVELPGGGRAEVTDTSPALGHLDPADVSDIVKEVAEGLGIEVVTVTPVACRAEEAAAWTVQHGQTGAFGRMAVVPA